MKLRMFLKGGDLSQTILHVREEILEGETRRARISGQVMGDDQRNHLTCALRGRAGDGRHPWSQIRLENERMRSKIKASYIK